MARTSTTPTAAEQSAERLAQAVHAHKDVLAQSESNVERIAQLLRSDTATGAELAEEYAARDLLAARVQRAERAVTVASRALLTDDMRLADLIGGALSEGLGMSYTTTNVPTTGVPAEVPGLVVVVKDPPVENLGAGTLAGIVSLEYARTALYSPLTGERVAEVLGQADVSLAKYGVRDDGRSVHGDVLVDKLRVEIVQAAEALPVLAGPIDAQALVGWRPGAPRGSRPTPERQPLPEGSRPEPHLWPAADATA